MYKADDQPIEHAIEYTDMAAEVSMAGKKRPTFTSTCKEKDIRESKRRRGICIGVFHRDHCVYGTLNGQDSLFF